jgi:2-phosphosulfolactate phosphatase
LFATTNGPVALAGITGARDVVVAAYVNFSPVCAMLRAALRGGGGADVAIICAGRERHFALEDATCAGRYVRVITAAMPDVVTNDAARACALLERQYGDDRAQIFADAEHGKALTEAGFAADLAVCAGLDTFPVVPVYQDRQITKLGPDRER